MVATPQHVPGENRDALVARLAALENTVRSLANKTLHSVSVVNSDGETLFSIGPSDFVDADGNKITILTINNPISGTSLLSQLPGTQVDNDDGTVEGSDWFVRMTDAFSNPVFATDPSGLGLAGPYLSVPMYMQWSGLLSTTPAADATGYATVVASGVATQKIMWSGKIPHCSHPNIGIEGIWGRATGSGAETATYTLTVSGSTVGSWQATTVEQSLMIFDISEFVGLVDLDIQLLMQSSVSNADELACQILGVSLRESAHAIF